MGTFAHFAAEAGRQEYEHRPHLLAFTFNDVPRNGIEQRDRTLHGGTEGTFEGVDVFLYWGFYMIELRQIPEYLTCKGTENIQQAFRFSR